MQANPAIPEPASGNTPPTPDEPNNTRSHSVYNKCKSGPTLPLSYNAMEPWNTENNTVMAGFEHRFRASDANLRPAAK